MQNVNIALFVAEPARAAKAILPAMIISTVNRRA
jgi:hypothetical protein